LVERSVHGQWCTLCGVKKKIKRIKKTDNTDNGVSVNNVYEVYLSYQVQCGNLRVIVV
jgi:hypothetical protein